jgi:hypothetical protein
MPTWPRPRDGPAAGDAAEPHGRAPGPAACQDARCPCPASDAAGCHRLEPRPPVGVGARGVPAAGHLRGGCTLEAADDQPPRRGTSSGWRWRWMAWEPSRASEGPPPRASTYAPCSWRVPRRVWPRRLAWSSRSSASGRRMGALQPRAGRSAKPQPTRRGPGRPLALYPVVALGAEPLLRHRPGPNLRESRSMASRLQWSWDPPSRPGTRASSAARRDGYTDAARRRSRDYESAGRSQRPSGSGSGIALVPHPPFASRCWTPTPPRAVEPEPGFAARGGDTAQ